MARQLVSNLSNCVGTEVIVEGWVSRVRNLGGITFLVLKERTGTVQVVVEKAQADLVPSLESVVRVAGEVVSSEQAPGGLEICARHIETLNPANSPLPIEVNGPELKCGLSSKLTHRVLALRNRQQMAIFRIQAAIAEAFENFLRHEGFLEVFTPKVIATGTEGGSELFELNYFGRPAYLAQSPQFYKEMMVASGAERVFEVGHAYRAEPHETARHLNEYVSLDVEVGFVTRLEELMELETSLMQAIFSSLQEGCSEELSLWKATPRCPSQIPRVTLAESHRILEGQGLEESRLDLSPEAERILCRYAGEQFGSEFLFVTEFPSAKRPFYAMPKPGAAHLTESFDLLYRGLEITTGGLRLHRLGELESRIRERGLEPEGFGSYLEAFRYGMPPHGGFAIGLERLTARILGLENVQEASLFPRTQRRLEP